MSARPTDEERLRFYEQGFGRADRGLQTEILLLRALNVEITRLRALNAELLTAAREVMRLLEEHGPSIVPHLMDDDENAGQRLRDAIAKAEERWMALPRPCDL